MTVQITRLLSGTNTLFGEPPSVIAEKVEDMLNEITLKGFEVISISAIPEYHNIGAYGGVKDIFFLYTEPSTFMHYRWRVIPILTDDNETMHGEESEQMLALLREAFVREGKVEHILPLTDNHFSSFLQGFGGFDGVKNILLCCKAEWFPSS